MAIRKLDRDFYCIVMRNRSLMTDAAGTPFPVVVIPVDDKLATKAK